MSNFQGSFGRQSETDLSLCNVSHVSCSDSHNQHLKGERRGEPSRRGNERPVLGIPSFSLLLYFCDVLPCSLDQTIPISMGVCMVAE